jgi:WD40 repeat protein
MSIMLVSSPLRRGVALVGAFGGLWVAALVCRVPGTPFGSSVPSAVSATELGELGTIAATSGEETCALAVSLDGTRLATGNRNGFVQLWDASTQSKLSEWKAHEKGISALAFTADGRRLLTSGYDLGIASWALENLAAPLLRSRISVRSFVTALAIAPNGQTLAVAHGDCLALLDLETGEALPEGKLSIPGAPILALAFGPDGTTLAAGGGGDNAIRVWGLNGGRPMLRRTLVSSEDHWLRGLAYSDDGATLVSVDTLGRLVAWDRAGHMVSQAHAGPESCRLAALGGQSRVLVTKDVSTNPPRVWQFSERWWQ